MNTDQMPIFKRLYQEPYAFDFFQAVRLLSHLPEAISRSDPQGPCPEVARFRAQVSLSFPASAIHDLKPPSNAGFGQLPDMTVTFMGMFGPSGIMPRHYTDQIMRIERETKGAEKRAFRDWLDLFNHRFIYLFYRAWDKYRFYLAHEWGKPELPEPDGFTRALLSFVGLGTPWLRNRMRITAPGPGFEPEQELARVYDIGLLRFSGLLSQQHRSAWGLGTLLKEYFHLPVEVRQFQGQWLPLEPESQSRMGMDGLNCELGVNLVAGDRVWDAQGKVRIRLGPLTYKQFLEYLPDRMPVPERKAFFLLSHVIRFYIGPELGFDVQLILRAEDVPECELSQDEATGPRLGWNCWLLCESPYAPAEDAIFEGETLTHVGDPRKSSRV